MHKPIPEYNSMEEILSDAIAEEASAKQWYIEASEKAYVPEIKSFLLKLAKMEEEHEEQLTECLHKVQSQMEISKSIMYSFGEECF